MPDSYISQWRYVTSCELGLLLYPVVGIATLKCSVSILRALKYINQRDCLMRCYKGKTLHQLIGLLGKN